MNALRLGERIVATARLNERIKWKARTASKDGHTCIHTTQFKLRANVRTHNTDQTCKNVKYVSDIHNTAQIAVYRNTLENIKI